MTTLTPVYLSAADIVAFKKFQKHYALIGLLDSLGVFDITSGSAEIHFDSMGNIGSVDVRRHYRPGKTGDK